jgi:uncharacterized membrane protein
MMTTMNGMDGMMGGAGWAFGMGLMMVPPTLLVLALLVLTVVAIVWLVRDLHSRTGHSPTSTRS